ncbi:hypothetical protein DFS33DRAFT_1424551 [Desarmillaria ectypa]|nr:hypothetical protein DFS33DRAFT_1424551 [Desarmillaria ectypa]
MSQQDVTRFNALPRTPRAPSGRVANDWHFNLRFIHLDPPSHLLFMVQPESASIHTEILGSKPMMFFPETGKEAAPEVVRGLIRAFLTSFGEIGMAPLAPWKLTTEDTDLATAVGAEFKRLCVRKELCKISVSHSNADIARESFESFFKGLKSHMNFSEMASVAVSCPESIAFRNFTPPSSVSRAAANMHREGNDDSSSFETALAYVSIRKNCIPVDFSKPVDHTWGAKIMKEIDYVLAMVKSKPEKVIKAQADAGDPEAALDYGFSPVLFLVVLPSIRKRLLRIDISLTVPSHANESVKLVPGKTSPSAMMYAQNVMKPQAEHADMEKGRAKMDQKRMARPNRYKCATVGCGIEAVSGRVFSRCSGKCDPDKKPYYCSKECREYHPSIISCHFSAHSYLMSRQTEKKDWKNHKPFCMPGAPCSVIGADGPSSIGLGSKKDSIQIPMKFGNGRTTMVSSSTMSPEFLKEMRDTAGRDKLPFAVEMGRLNIGSGSGLVEQSAESEEVD